MSKTISDPAGRIRRACFATLFLLSFPIWILCGCAENNDSTVAPESLESTALHNTASGMEYWYEREQGGVETITGIAFDDLSCKNCHVPVDGCLVCHATLTGDIPADTRCTDLCHGRQRTEIQLGLTDVHREAGIGCAGCHTSDEVHGDGNRYDSMLADGALEASCTAGGCHDVEDLDANLFHSNHLGNMECGVCHAQTVVTCYNCHFESEVSGDGKIAAGQFTGWKFLVRSKRTDKIALANIQTLTYDNKAFVAIAPFHAHTIARNAVTSCRDCHNNSFVQEYESTGRMTIVTWNDAEHAFVPAQGIIPVPSDWETALQFSFGTLDPADPVPPNWIKITPTEIGHQMLFAKPLEELPNWP